jgi:hypothetical protein
MHPIPAAREALLLKSMRTQLRDSFPWQFLGVDFGLACAFERTSPMPLTCHTPGSNREKTASRDNSSSKKSLKNITSNDLPHGAIPSCCAKEGDIRAARWAVSWHPRTPAGGMHDPPVIVQHYYASVVAWMPQRDCAQHLRSVMSRTRHPNLPPQIFYIAALNFALISFSVIA